ncbi:MAG: cupin domain-containing protein [Clostridium sp.]|jgi:quercetin dioxygenase-like cupin family protein|uniref:cupin domain-containing protein n=1 Tax=Clostridium sp. TaxID=1506 RepID=UPI0025BFAE9D|nr:cupin domain-containing protein [Clostridium sp.]MCH3964516.1 cupin domain-containing protein [Clostridium sp.]MCI1714988.1 cupin domain-containing protein [Clostridium sp.]MCI1799250.1 cupin domain-containing protein [Clostridium sp.]MCI1813171.1 cupin domain-containing protein [Clostridium sp.]MCI1870061.1 cupin domain-containing protein [Clostridium sp.]
MDRKELEKVSDYLLGEENTAYAQYFIGKSYLSLLNNKEVTICNVTFEPGCHNNWHIHHGSGQILICVGGHGWYQEMGKNPQLLKNGDVVYIAPEIKDWHGAVKDEAFAHLALSAPAEGSSSNEWCEPVTDEEYKKWED